MAQETTLQEEMAQDFEELFGNRTEANDSADSESGNGPAKGGAHEVDLSQEGFPPITKRFDEPHGAFNDAAYYKTIISGEGEVAVRVHGILQKYLGSKDPKDKGIFRQQFITTYWSFLINVVRKCTGQLPNPKKYLLRFAILHPGMMDSEMKNFFPRVVDANVLNPPVYYLDEWFKSIGSGLIKPSSTDEVRVAGNNISAKYQQMFEKAKGKLDGARNFLKTKDEERHDQETLLKDMVAHILEHSPEEGLPRMNACYDDGQKKAVSDVQEILKNLIRIDREIEKELQEYYRAEQDCEAVQEKIDTEGIAQQVDVNAIDTEFETIRQMTKMTIGRQGNHFPLLTNEYFHCTPTDIGYRENVISMLAWVESVDPEAFTRVHRNRLNRIVPFVILLPCYGDTGMCWEPFDRFNRATSRGRIAIPMYPKSLQIAVLSAVGDLRWQVAKERASFNWMDEGITGNYYQWFQKNRLKGDLKSAFIEDYILWMTKESDAVQKLDKELRGIFWRYIPFSKETKEKLKTRSFTYQELYQRDVNRSMSDGY
jgi:hypothetical protein